MGKDAPKQWSDAVKAKLAELIELVADEEYGPQGPPLETTFSEIEEIGHQVGQMAAGAFDSAAQRKHADHFQQQQPCPQCGAACPMDSTRPRELQTRDGHVTLDEPCCRCDACKRSFFPSAARAAAGRPQL